MDSRSSMGSCSIGGNVGESILRLMGYGYSLLSTFSEMSFFFSGMSFIGSGVVVVVWLFFLVVTVSIRLPSSCVVAVPGVVSGFAAVEAEVFLLLSFLLLIDNMMCETGI